MERNERSPREIQPYDAAIVEDILRDLPELDAEAQAVLLQEIKEAMDNADSGARRLEELIIAARERQVTWAAIGGLSGVSRQAAQERWKKVVPKKNDT